MRLSELGELGLLAELERRGLVQGIEDDVAVLAPGSGSIVVTQDALVEDVHFRLAWTSWRDLGYKAAAVNLSDLAAAGAEPSGLLVTLALPAETALDDVLELYAGLGEAGVPVIGGDTTSAPVAVLDVTALGRSPRVPGRSGARAGDVLAVTGPLGASGAGLASLERGLGHPLETAHRRPPLRLAEGRRLAAVAHALLDVSDGLATDAGHVAARSSVRCVVDAGAVPRAEGVDVVAAAAGLDPVALACAFGEDYELLAALDPADAAALPGLHVVGRCEEGAGLAILRGGEPAGLSGWQHFR